MSDSKQLQQIPIVRTTANDRTDSAALQFALYLVRRYCEEQASSAIDPLADRATTELERLISGG